MDTHADRMVVQITMLSKLSSDPVIKGYIKNYTKIKDSFKKMLQEEGFYWRGEWYRENMSGKEGVWLNPISKLSIRIRWGVTKPCAIVYAEPELEEILPKFFDKYEFSPMNSPNQDYDILNKGF